MDWKTVLLTLALAFYADGYSKYGRTCRDIGCLNSEVCVLAEDPCSFGHTRDCGTYPTCKKKSQVEGSHAEPSAPKPAPAPAPVKPQTHDFDSPPSYNPPAPPPGGNSPYGGNSNGGGSTYGGNSNGGGSPYGGNSNGGGSPYGGNSNGGGSPYGGNPYGGGSHYGGSSPYGGNSNGGGSPYGGSGGYNNPSSGGNSPYGGSGGNPYGGHSSYGGGSGSGGYGTPTKSPLDTIFNTLNKYAGGGGQGGSGGAGLSNIFGNVLGNLSKSGGLSNIFNTRPVMENPSYASAGSNTRSSNPQNYPSGYQQNQAPSQSRNYGQNNAHHSGATTRKPYQSYGWSASASLVLTYFIHRYIQNVINT